MSVIAYVHPTCTSCRKAEQFLSESGVAFERRDYFRDRFSVEELRETLAEAGVSPFDILSKRSKVYRARPEEIEALDEDGLLAAMVEEPTLLRRPLIVAGDQVVIGYNRPGLEALVSSTAGKA